MLGMVIIISTLVLHRLNRIICVIQSPASSSVPFFDVTHANCAVLPEMMLTPSSIVNYLTDSLFCALYSLFFFYQRSAQSESPLGSDCRFA